MFFSNLFFFGIVSGFNSNSSSDNIAHFSIQYDKQFNSGWALNYNIELQNSLNVSFESTIGIGITKNF